MLNETLFLLLKNHEMRIFFLPKTMIIVYGGYGIYIKKKKKNNKHMLVIY